MMNSCGAGGCGSDSGGSCGGGACAPCSVPKIQIGDFKRPACVKCKVGAIAQAMANHSEPVCAACLRTSLFAKFKTAVNINGLITPADKVLLAFSGGTASRVALEFLQDVRSKAQHDADASNSQGLQVFGLGCLFVSEATVLNIPPLELQAAVKDMHSIILDTTPKPVKFHAVPLECAFDYKHTRWSAEVTADTTFEFFTSQLSSLLCEQRLKDLFRSVEDQTGKEDLLEYLRMEVLQKVAQEHGYTKVALGLCASRIASRIIAATTKGQGFSLPADIQYIDRRREVPVILPLRDCMVRELALHCQLFKLKTVFIRNLTTMAGSCGSLNSLAHSFVNLLQEENPSREYTILRTAAKLKAFAFNQPDEPVSRRRHSSQILRGLLKEKFQPSAAESLCPICSAPLLSKDSAWEPYTDTDKLIEMSKQTLEFIKMCCPSCRLQIFPEDGCIVSLKYELLPDTMRERALVSQTTRQNWMRSQVEDCLLPQVEGDE